MEIRCRCPACQAKFDIAPKHAGKTIHCPRCKGPVEIPGLDAPGWQGRDAPAPLAANQVESPPPVMQPPAVPLPPPADNPIVPPPVAGMIGPPPVEAFPAIELNVAPGGLSTGTAVATRRAAARGKRTSVWPLLIAGGVLLLAGGVLLGLYLSQDGSQDAASHGGAAGTGNGSLILAWPEQERQNASLAIDGRNAGIAGTGELRYELRAGTHDVLIERGGFEPFVQRVELRGGASQQVSPVWKSIAGATSEVDGAQKETARAGSHRSVRGFEGWLASFDAARKQAAADQQEIVLVFGSSDAQATTQELAQALKEPSVQNALGQRVRVMIDLPRMPLDRDQAIENRRLMDEFGVTRLPALALADKLGRTYAIEKRWERGFDRLADRLEELQKQRIDRDRLMTAAEKGSEADKIGAASVTVKWLHEQGLWSFYRPEIRAWAEMAERLDPKNEQKLLEAFFEPQWMLRVQETNPSDAADVQGVAEELQPWIERKFGDADRGARVHLAAVKLLTDARRFEDAMRQMEQAVKYQPRDARLAESIRHVQQHLDNKDVLGSGSGFLVTAAGHVLTNQHVVDGSGEIVIRVPNSKETLAAEVVAQDANRDLALLKIDLPKGVLVRPLALRVSDLRRGAAVALFGYPLGDALGANLKFTAGTISALPEESNNQMYLLDATVNPGSSGGPLCDQRGNVVGLVSAKTGGSTLEDSYGLAIPAAAISKFLDQHLPVEASRPLADSNDSPLNWDLVDERVSGGVLMVVKKKP